MPTMADVPRSDSRRAQVIECFKNEWASRVNNPNEAHASLMQRFGVSRAYLYQMNNKDLWPLVKEAKYLKGRTQVISTTTEEQDVVEPVHENDEIAIPHGLPKESMAAFLALLEKARGAEKELALKEAELTAARNQQILASKRIATLKAISKEAIEAI